MTVRETALAAIKTLLDTAFAADADMLVTRNSAFAERIDTVDGRWINLLDGAVQGEPVELCGGGVEFNHLARIVLMVRGDDDAARDAQFDADVGAIVTALPTSQTLGGTVDLLQVRPAEELAPEVAQFAVGFKAGVLPVLILYTAPNAAG